MPVLGLSGSPTGGYHVGRSRIIPPRQRTTRAAACIQGARPMLDTKPDKAAIPFDTKRLDDLMEQAGIDVLLANSKHNVQYLLGGHRSIFFDYMDALGISRSR